MDDDRQNGKKGMREGKNVRYDRGDGKKYNLWNIEQWMKKGWKGEKRKITIG